MTRWKARLKALGIALCVLIVVDVLVDVMWDDWQAEPSAEVEEIRREYRTAVEDDCYLRYEDDPWP